MPYDWRRTLVYTHRWLGIAGGGWQAAFADTGERLDGLTRHEVLEVSRWFRPEHEATIEPSVSSTAGMAA